VLGRPERNVIYIYNVRESARHLFVIPLELREYDLCLLDHILSQWRAALK
jgi:hypothetical protein